MIIHVLARKRTVYVQNPFCDVACHVIQTKVVGWVKLHLHGNVGLVVEVSSYAHVVACTALVVGEHVTLNFFIAVSHRRSVPSVLVSVNLSGVHPLSNLRVGSVFPLRFGREAVLRQKDSIFDAGWAAFFAINLRWTEVLEALAVLLGIFSLLVEVNLRVKVLVVGLSIHHGQDALID